MTEGVCSICTTVTLVTIVNGEVVCPRCVKEVRKALAEDWRLHHRNTHRQDRKR